MRVLPDGRMAAREGARYLGVTEKSLANWRSDGRGPRFLKRMGRIWYRQEWLDEWLEKGDRVLSLVHAKPRAKRTYTPPLGAENPVPIRIADVCTITRHRHRTGVVTDESEQDGNGGER